MMFTKRTLYRQAIFLLFLFILGPGSIAAGQSGNSADQPTTHKPNNSKEAHSWNYIEQPATNPQPWSAGCPSNRPLSKDSTKDQLIQDEHTNWHCTNGPNSADEEHGRHFIAFHRQFILDYDSWRLKNGADRVEYWDPSPVALIPGNDETANTDFTHCTDQKSIRPKHTECKGCQAIPDNFRGSSLDRIASVGDLGNELEPAWHVTFHGGVAATGCSDMASFNTSPNDPTFYMAHKKLDEIARDWQSRQAADIVIVLDRSGSMDDNCPGSQADPNESPCAINDAREAASSFADFMQDERKNGNVPVEQQHRIGLVSFSNSAKIELNLTPAKGIVSNNKVDDTPFEKALAGLSADGATSIGAGIREAVKMLKAVPNPNPHQAILVLTDGKENTVPCLAGNSQSDCHGEKMTTSEIDDIQVVAVGLGDGAQEANLRDVAERQGGILVAQPNVTDPVSKKLDPVKLQKFFVTAFGRIFDENVSVDPITTLQAGQAINEPIKITIGDDTRLSAIVGWSNPLHIITFESLATGDIVHNQYLGTHSVEFLQGVQIVAPPQGTASGVQALKAHAEPECLCNPQIEVRFTSDQSIVKMAVGLDEATLAPVQAVLKAFDKDGNPVGQPVTTMLGSAPTPIHTPLTIASLDANNQPNIRRVVLDYDNSIEVIDNLEFDNFAPSVRENDPPIVKITQPASGTNSTSPNLDLRGTIEDTSELADVRLVISYPNQPPYSIQLPFYQGGPPVYTLITPSLTGVLAIGVNTITVIAKDIHGNIGQDSVSLIWQPCLDCVPTPFPAPATVANFVQQYKQTRSTTKIAIPNVLTSEESPDCSLQLELYTPSGNLIDRFNQAVEAGDGLRHDFRRVNLPYLGESTGEWTAHIVRKNKDAYCGTQSYFYSTLTKGFGRVDPFPARPEVTVGQPILAAFRISESNRPVGGYDKVQAEVALTRPDGKQQAYPLYDDGTNGDKLAGNNLWSIEIPDTPQEPGVYTLRSHFLLTKNNVTVTREAEYFILVQPAPTQCMSIFTSGLVNGAKWYPPQSGKTTQLDDFVCVRNRCANPDQYELQISDSKGWLKMLDSQTGQPVTLPSSFQSGVVEGFGEQCFGPETSAENPGGGVKLLGVIPSDAKPGDQSLISVNVKSANHNQETTNVTTTLQIFPPPDCNENGIPDETDLANKTSKDVNNNDVPDICERGHFHMDHLTVDLSLTMSGISGEIEVGQNVTYTLIVTNSGPDVASGVMVSSSLPVEFDFISAIPSRGTCTVQNNVITCKLGELEVASKAKVVMIFAPRKEGTLTLQVGVMGHEHDMVSGNNVESREIKVTPPTALDETNEPQVPVLNNHMYLPIVSR